jgi:hypothetical protein
MFRSLLVLFVGVAVVGLSVILGRGCRTAPAPTLSPRQRATAHALEVAWRLNKLVGPDGWHIRVTDSGDMDANEIPYRVEYRRGPTVNTGVWYEQVVIKGAGPDGEWGTADDIEVTAMISHATPRDCSTSGSEQDATLAGSAGDEGRRTVDERAQRLGPPRRGEAGPGPKHWQPGRP